MISIDQWAGLVTNASPYSVTSTAAATQVNLQVLSPGQLTVRPGLQPVSFAAHVGSTDTIRRAFWHPDGHVVYQSADGAVRVATGPS